MNETVLSYTVEGACKATGLGKTLVYELMAAGILDARKVGGKTIILAPSLHGYVASRPKAVLRTVARCKAAI